MFVGAHKTSSKIIFPLSVFSECLSPQFACYFLSNYMAKEQVFTLVISLGDLCINLFLSLYYMYHIIIL